MLGCYKRDEAADPEIFMRAVISVLLEYPEWTVHNVTEPSSGIPSKIKWLPSIAEIKEACEEQVGHLRRNADREEHVRKAFKALPSLEEVDDLARERVDRLVEKFKRETRGTPDPEVERRKAKAFTDNLERMVAAGRSPLAEAGKKQEAAE